jgi:hypothetical protein
VIGGKLNELESRIVTFVFEERVYAGCDIAVALRFADINDAACDAVLHVPPATQRLKISE